MTEQQSDIKKANGIDLIELGKSLYKERRKIIKITLAFTLIGLFVAIFSPKEYTTTVIMVPQSSNNQANMGALSGLAAMAGINLNTRSQAEMSPLTYPQIVSSIPFMLELMDTPFTFDKIDHPVTLYEYYSEHAKPSFIYKYTLGLPRVISKALKKKNYTNEGTSSYDIVRITEEQMEICDILEKNIKIELNQMEGHVKLSCSMPEAFPSAQLAMHVQQLLQQKITDYKIQKATNNLEFIQQRYIEVRQQYNQTQEALAKFNDSNKNVITAIAQTESERLRNDYNLSFSIYSELARQLEQAKIQVKEDTPVFTIIKPASVPLKKSKPQRGIIIFVCFFIGLVAGTMVSFFPGFYHSIKGEK